MRTGDWRLFAPSLDDSGAAYALLVRLAILPAGQALRAIALALGQAQRWTEAGLRLEAALMLIRDLIALGWQTKSSDGWLYLRPGSSDDDPRAAARRQLEFGRDDQLSEPSNRRFIMSIERPGRFSKCLPVTTLIADGRDLARDVEEAAALQGEARAAALARVCQPYLQLVTPDARDELTNLRLMDVWRYFRHSWASRYRSSPGRNLFYLIRDAARPSHPVMGITALGNAVMQLTQRDAAIGWTLDGMRTALADGRVADSELLEGVDFHPELSRVGA